MLENGEWNTERDKRLESWSDSKPKWTRHGRKRGIKYEVSAWGQVRSKGLDCGVKAAVETGGEGRNKKVRDQSYLGGKENRRGASRRARAAGARTASVRCVEKPTEGGSLEGFLLMGGRE